MVSFPLIVLSTLALAAQPQGMVLDFSATWCGPCQEMSPLVSRLEREGYPIRKVDIDQERDLAKRFNVSSIPAFVLVVNGKEVSRRVGKMSEVELKQMLAQIPVAKDEVVASTPRQPKQEQQQFADVAEKPAKPKRRFPFLSKPEQPAEPTGPAVMRAKLDDSRPAGSINLPATPMNSSVRLRIKDTKGENFGSGTIIDSRVGRTFILTCGHVFRNLDESSTIEVDVFFGKQSETYVGKLIRHDQESDVGLISIPTDNPLPACRVAPAGTKLLKGTPVVSVGCGGGEKPSAQSIRVTALNRYLGPDNLECSGVPVQGRSGGGLFTKEGFVVGVCTAADTHDQKGLYAGLKAIQELLDRSQLTQLYQPAGQKARPAVALADADLGSADNPNDDFEEEAQVAGVRETNLPRPTRARAVRNAVAEAAATLSETDEDDALQQAIKGLGPSEVVCVIRPINQPRAASRVIVINRASSKFVNYLTDEIDAQSEVRNTMLTTPRKDIPMDTPAVAELQMPAAAVVNAAENAAQKAYTPKAYRRSRGDAQ